MQVFSCESRSMQLLSKLISLVVEQSIECHRKGLKYRSATSRYHQTIRAFLECLAQAWESN